MELASLFLLILMPPADATGETAQALTATLRSELGDVAMLVAPDTLVTPAMWKGRNASMRAPFIARVIATGDTKVTVEVMSNRDEGDTAPFLDRRDMEFSPADSKAERGRAMALVLAELLRESPSAVLMIGSLGHRRALVVDGLFGGERVNSGAWAIGPKASFGLGLSEALWLKASGRAYFSSTMQYSGIGVGLGLVWRFLRSEGSRHYLGLGADLAVLHESATLPAGGEEEPAQSESSWNAGLVPSLVGAATLWRGLRLIGSVDAGLLAASLSTSQYVKEDDDKAAYYRTFAYSRFRPGFTIGLELAL